MLARRPAPRPAARPLALLFWAAAAIAGVLWAYTVSQLLLGATAGAVVGLALLMARGFGQ